MIKKIQLKGFCMILCISTLIINTSCCSNREKDISDDLQSKTEITVLTDLPQSTPEISPEVSTNATNAFTGEVLDETFAEEDVLIPMVDDVNNFTPKDIAEGKPSSRRIEKEFSISPRSNEVAEFYRFYYMDNKNLLNTFFWEYKTGSDLKYTSCRLYKEQQDGTIKDTEITWNSDADKIINLINKGDDMFSIMSQWFDANNGNFYIIVCKWTFDSNNNPTFLYGINSNGELFINIQLEDYLVMDKINPGIYACGYTIDFIGQDNGIAYFEYKDNSQYAVVYYDMNNNCFIKQIFTGYSVKGIIDGQYVGVSDQQLIIGSIPEGIIMTNTKGNSITIGKSDIQQAYHLPEYRGIYVNGKYVYMLSTKQYQRYTLGDDGWETLADVSQITESIKGDLYICDFIAKNSHTFLLLLYADCGAGFYINVYYVE